MAKLSMCPKCKEKSVAFYLRRMVKGGKAYRYRKCINHGCDYYLIY